MYLTKEVEPQNGHLMVFFDDEGNIYLGGQSSSTWGTPVNNYADGYDPFVTKLRPGGCKYFIFKSADGKVTAICL